MGHLESADIGTAAKLNLTPFVTPFCHFATPLVLRSTYSARKDGALEVRAILDPKFAGRDLAAQAGEAADGHGLVTVAGNRAVEAAFNRQVLTHGQLALHYDGKSDQRGKLGPA